MVHGKEFQKKYIYERNPSRAAMYFKSVLNLLTWFKFSTNDKVIQINIKFILLKK
jgi:hypothetical protein